MPPSTTDVSKDVSEGVRSGSAPGSSQQSVSSLVRLSQVENIRVVEAEDVLGCDRAGERMSLFDILREDLDEARARVEIERKDSSFREHL